MKMAEKQDVEDTKEQHLKLISDQQEQQGLSAEHEEHFQDADDGSNFDRLIDDEQLVVIETPEGLTVLDTPENYSLYFDPETEEIESVTESSPSDGCPEPADSDQMDLPSTVTKVETGDGCKVYIVGTAHFSKESQEDVTKTIKTLQPDVVLVELCKSRVEILRYDEECLMKEAKNIDLQKLRSAIKQAGVVGGVMQVLLLSMSAHITKQLGMAPGGEFRAAYKEAKKVPDCDIHLGDRPIQITLSRAMAALNIWQKMKLAWHLITSKEPISVEDVEKCKQKDLLAEMLAEMTGDFPSLCKVFVNERDQYLAHSLRLSTLPVQKHGPDGEHQICIPRVIVGVVGIGHVQGIVENWEKDIDIQELLKVPPPSTSSRLLRLSLKAAFGIFIAWGCYKLLRWTKVESMIPFYR